MYITLYRKYRPKEFSEVYGEDDIIRSIKNGLRDGRFPHAYLFTGPRGVGKTTTARLIAKGINCITNGISDNPCNVCENCREIDSGSFFDLIEIDGASNRGIDEIRALKDKINYQPVKGRKKVYIIDEVHMLTKEAFNGLLKTLEEPPGHVLFILATTEPDKILDTIISRCQRYDFSTVTLESMTKRLKEIAANENIEIDSDSLEVIYEKSGGSMRDSISILEKVFSTYSGEKIDSEKTEKALGIIPEKIFLEFVALIKSKEIIGANQFLERIYFEGVRIDEFFKNFAYFIKNKTLKEDGLFSTKESVRIIESVYETVNKFKYEEDKRLLGFLIINKLIDVKNDKPVLGDRIQEIKVEKAETIIKPEVQKTEQKSILTGDFSIEGLLNKWFDVVKKAKENRISIAVFLENVKPQKIEGNVITLGFLYENIFNKISMEKKENKKILVDILEDIFARKIELKLEFIDESKQRGNDDDEGELTKKVIDFFEGEIIEVR